MNLSFYTASVGAGGEMAKMDVLANNLSNVNTNGYKSRNAVFSDLVYSSMAAGGGTELQVGHSMRLDKTDILYNEPGAFRETGGAYDFAISGNGFFSLEDPVTGEISYTRDGHFQLTNLDGIYYLTDYKGRHVLDYDSEAVQVKAVSEADGGTEEVEGADELLENRIGLFKVPVRNGMEAVGENGFMLVEKNGEPYSQTDAEEDEPHPKLLTGTLEMSNVNLAKEISTIIEAQRSYQYALRMVGTSDEIEQLQNELRR